MDRVRSTFCSVVALVVLGGGLGFSQHVYWAKRYCGSTQAMTDWSYAITVDAAKNVYVTGGSWAPVTGIDFGTLKYDQHGTLLWSQMFNDPNANGADYAYDLAVDGSGNVFVTGCYWHDIGGTKTFDYGTVKYDASGVFRWIKYYNSPVAGMPDEPHAIGLDVSGYVYVTGQSPGIGTSNDFLTIKYDPATTNQGEVWTARYDNVSDHDIAEDLAVRGAFVYVTGSSVASGTYEDYATIKYRCSDGGVEPNWPKRYEGPGHDRPVGVRVDANDNVYVTGYCMASTSYIHTVVYYTDNTEWHASWDGGGYAYDLEVDGAGNIYIAGGGAVGNQAFVLKYTPPNTTPVWVRTYAGPDGLGGEFLDLALDGVGNIVVTGRVTRNIPTENTDIPLVKYDAAGSLLWETFYSGPENAPDRGVALTVDGEGSVLVTGNTRTASTAEDYITAKYASDMLSDDAECTAFNWGRHLLREPLTGQLHLVYHTSSGPCYTSSYDGLAWDPVQVLDYSGKYPSVGIIPNMMEDFDPCLVYVDQDNKVKYRWFNRSTGLWEGSVLRNNTGGYNGPPSVATTGDGFVYVVVPVRNMPKQAPAFSLVKFYSFFYDGSGLDSFDLDWIGNNTAIWDPCITYDADYNLHVVWRKSNEIIYRMRDVVGGTWTTPFNVSSHPRPDFTPFVETYSTWLSAVWCKEQTSGQQNSREIYRRRKNLASGTWPLPASSYSESPGLPSESPVNASEDVSVWCENELTGNDFDVKYRSDTHGFGWVTQLTPKEYYCHSQIQRDWTPWFLYTALTEGNSVPYRVKTYRNQLGTFSPSPFYAVQTGESLQSPFCLKRDGALRYSGYKVDHGTNEIGYKLHFLDPVYPVHVLKGTLYFEGTGQKTHQLLVNNVEKLSAKVNAGQPYPFELSIPRELYQADHRITLTLRSTTGTGVYLAALEVIRSIEGKSVGSGRGVQSTQTEQLGQTAYLRLRPNPAATGTVISYSVLGAGRVSLKVFDPIGRLVRVFGGLPNRPTSITWDGCDQTGVRVAKGVYFIELVSGKDVRTEKLVITR